MAAIDASDSVADCSLIEPVTASVVIRAKNEEQEIGATLDGVFGQTGVPRFEVIVVDSGSTDRTLEIIRRFTIRLVQIRPEDFSYGRSLNRGIAEAHAELVVILSAHSAPVDQHWLAEIMKPFSDPTVAGVYGRQVPRANATFLERFNLVNCGLLSLSARRQERDMMFSNVNSAVRRRLALAHPFAEDIRAGEDFEWADWYQRCGWAVYYQPTAAVYHSHGDSLMRLARRLRNDQPDIFRLKIAAFFPRARPDGPGPPVPSSP